MQNKRLLKGNPPSSGEKIVIDGKNCVLGEQIKSSSDGHIYHWTMVYLQKYTEKSFVINFIWINAAI